MIQHVHHEASSGGEVAPGGITKHESLSHSKRFQKLNGLEVGTKTMVNPDQNIVVEAGNTLHVIQQPLHMIL